MNEEGELTTTTAKAAVEAEIDDDDSPITQQEKKKKKKTMFGWKDRKRKRMGGDGEKKERVKNVRRDNSDEEQIPHVGSYAHPGMKNIAALTNLPESESFLSLKGFNENEGGNAGGAAESDDDDSATATRKFAKHKVAILMGFVGSKYSGMAMNPDQRTIQGEVEQALYRAGCITKANYGFPNKYSWSNSARTDKGVHSCAQVCSAKLRMVDDDWNIVRKEVNRFLPQDIRILDILKTKRKFYAKTAREKVRYMYMLPSFMLYEREALRKVFEDRDCHKNSRHKNDPLSDEDIDAVRDQLSKYRVPSERLEKLRAALKRYEGTHSYHNYTNGKTSDDKSAKRYMMSFIALDPVVDEFGTEWIPTQVVGQSFLLHQIRKMVCMATEVARGATDMDAFESTFTNIRIPTATAPAQGLFLDMSYFDAYNNDKRHQIENPILWHQTDDKSNLAAQRIQEFKEQVVMKHVMAEEAAEANFVKFLFVQEFMFDRKNYSAEKVTEGKD
mmetsp:Transcript_14314/g.22067  ORF Transcript_14314/g.22067 Transcript_14314/m.22067 type:complete len:501 (-) Transcript_14314:727-2229(-)|eukprot:CAMPEP_0196804770 /NCGR_PEP_ID=MMETSP1362-20130617/4436_1 /TAXON_ID=163516 /ORGANISM="Leptocylindrus danicus, Strain CCMP1856" /LENGTH=500 /DNA_ID=CAMNT_0042177271 /DNA_START=320 /DNA_END=1822 /DNA_ORIENTATION=+